MSENDLSRRLARLSPEKRALLLQRLQQKQQQSPREKAIPRRQDADSFPLSFAQQRLWFLDQFEPDSPFYNIPAALRIEGPLDVAALSQSFDEIVRRHQVLRASFVSHDGQPLQVIAPEMTVPLTVIDLQGLPEADREREVLDLATKEARRPFDLSQGPLLRAWLLRLAEKEHVALVTMHHIVFDGWSTGVLVRELSTLYQAFCAGWPSPLPELPIQYADYAAWQREWLQGEVLDRQLAYWRQTLADCPPLLELPTDHPRPPTQTFHGGHFSFELPADLSRRLEALSREQDATLFMTLLAAFQILLYRYTGQQDICVGTPVANRSREEVEGLIGFFVNTLVIRTDLGGEPTFRQLLGRVRQVALEAYAHQDLPFEMLVEAVQPERVMSHSPLFQVMFDLQSTPLASLRLGDLALGLLPVETGVAKFDLMLAVEEGADRLRGEMEYNTDLFDPATIRRLAGHFEVLLAGIVAQPDESIARLPLLTEAERQQVLVEWNDTARPYPQDSCFHHLFEAQAARTPEAAAVVYEGRQMSYGELDRRANQLARYLQRLGVGPERLVGLCLDRSVEAVVGILGILKAGGAYLPLDPSYPEERLAFMLDDARSPVVLTHTGLTANLPVQGRDVVYLDADWERIARESTFAPESHAGPGSLAYVIYTSGSTGKPKGVMIQHRSMVHLAAALQHIVYQHHPGGPLRLSLNAPLSFDASVQQLVMLLYGHTLYILPHEVRRDAAALQAYLADHRIDVLDCVPSQLKLLLSAGFMSGSDWTPAAVLPGGEAIDETTWQVLAESVDTEFYNMYGPTECTVDSTIGWVRMAGPRPTIGRPVTNARLYILDHHLQPVPIGVAGEIYIGGQGVGRGYLYRPELTARQFIPDPFGIEPGARLYKTGDLGRFFADGHIEFLGRIDHQVKVRGFRIELGEIEVVLKQHPMVRESVAVVRKDVAGDGRLVAYVVLEERSALVPNELRAFLKQRLPEYYVPSVFVQLEALPLTPNGKVDRKALPAPELSRADLESAYLAPRTPLEEMLAAVWAQLLNIEQVGVHDNFFELGGHSLLATQVVSRVRAAFQVELPLRKFFELPTVATLAEQIDGAMRAAAGVQSPPIVPVLRDVKMPLSFAQQRLWFLDHLEPGSPLYNIAAAVRVVGSLDAGALAHSLNEIVRRHEVLRTTFRTQDGRPAQVVAPEMHLSLPLTDLGHLPAEEREAEALRLAQEEAQRPFDLARGPLLRARLLRLEQQDHIVLLTMHHIVSDGWSMGVLIRELSELYPAFLAGQPSPLPPLPLQYVDFAHWQRGWLQGEALEAQLDYWRQQLAGSLPLLELPTDRPRPAVQSVNGALQSFKLSRSLSAELRALSRQEGVTLFMLLLAAFQTLLYRYSGQEDISVGTPIANRNRAEVEGLIGFFVNTLVIRGDLSGGPSFRELLRRLREAALGAYAHQDVPFEMVVDALQPQRELSHNPLFQVMFALQNAPSETVVLPGLILDSLAVDSGTAKFDLTLSLTEQDGELGGALEYNSDLFEGETIERLIGHYQTLLAGIVAHPEQSVDSLPLLTEAERQQLVVTWNQTEAPYPAGLCVHELFAAQAARTPEAAAVVYEGRQMSYGELDRRANQLARYLQQLGVGPERLVGLCLDRSSDLIVGILGILKAGAAYLPMDPSYPAERLAFMLADAGVQVLLTQAHLKERMGESARHTVCLDAGWELMAGEEDSNPVSDVRPDNLAYVIYTSGSTGRPKGVLLHHRGLCNMANAYVQFLRIGPGSRVLQFFSPNFDGSVADIFMALLSGATLCLVSQEALALGEPMVDFMRQQSITHGVLTPSVLSTLPEADLPDMQAILTGGEACVPELVKKWAPGRRFVNVYGPTEATVVAAWHEVETPSIVTSNVPIGRPIINSRLYILDGQMQPVPVGVPGELYIGGVGVGRGYLNRPELTAERFIADPFSPDPAARLYRTGDLCRYRRDGHIEFLGRMDHQVKVRGFRIELGEVEAALGGHEAVQEVVVVAREDEPGRKRLVAYVVWGGAEVSVGELRGYLSERLPEYMVPA
ncbi:MAG: amino acid adenylation domain-containing protein, partial [Chloroflexota bacterium]